MKSLSFWFVEVMIWSLLPVQAASPWWIKMMFSPIPITEFMSWVLMMVVVWNSCVIPCNSSSITKEVLGSNPEFGSSQNRYLGFRAMARAMATRFCIPPESSPGNFFSAPMRFTRSRQSMARLVRSLRFIEENISRGNITFSNTEMESKRAALWKIIPISRRSSTFSFFDIATKSRPSYSTSPLVGSRSPTIFFISTVFPEPLCPIIRLVFPFSNIALMSCSTSLSSNDL